MTECTIYDKVRYLGGDVDGHNDLTIGKTYVINFDEDLDAYIRDDLDEMWHISSDNRRFYELVTEPTEGTSVVASQSVIDLLTNLALRLTKVEDKIGNDVLISKEADEMDNDTTTQSESFDNVNSPQHYRHGRFETIELIEDITKKYDDGFVAYCVGNAVKYVDRAPFKHGSPSEDLRKAAWYLTRAAEHTDAQ